MLTEAEKKWLERRKVGMCCRCVHYYTDITDCGVGCQWIANKDFPMLQCFRFRNEDYTIEKGDWADAAEFEARVAVSIAQDAHNCALDEMTAQHREGDRPQGWYILRDARLTVESEMELTHDLRHVS